MRKIFFLVCLLSGALIPASAQTTFPTPLPPPLVARPSRSEPTPGAGRIDRTQGVLVAARAPAYRKPTKDDLRLVAPERADEEKYADFLRQTDTGLIRLLSDAGCQENAALVVASDFCIKYKNLFGASAYSFRTENYTLGRFSDVVYKNGSLYSVGKMTLGFLVDLGDAALRDVSAGSAGARYVFDFQPPDELAQIESALINFQKGVEAGGFVYRKSAALRENHTYLLRSVAYRKREQVERNKPVYDDLVNDERKDVIVAFRVVRFDDAEKSGVTLLWKELQRKNTSKIAVGKK